MFNKLIFTVLFSTLHLVGFPQGKILANKSDTLLAQYYIAKADTFYNHKQFDSAAVFYKNAGYIYEANNLWSNSISSYYKAGKSFSRNRKPDSSLSACQKALDIKKFQYGIMDSVILKSCYYNLGVISHSRGKLDSASFYYNKFLQLALRNIVDSNTLFQELSYYYSSMGQMELLNGGEQAEKYFQQSLFYTLKTKPVDDFKVAAIYANWGDACREIGNFDKALLYCNKAINFFSQNNSGLDYIIYLNITKGDILAQIGKYQDAINVYQNLYCQIISDSIYKYNKEILAAMCHVFADLDYNIGKYDEALKNYNLSLESYLQSLPINEIQISYIYHDIGRCMIKNDSISEAIENFNKSLNVRKNIFGEKHPLIAVSYYSIGYCYMMNEEYSKALVFIQKSFISAIANFNDTNLYVNPTIDKLNIGSDMIYELNAKAMCMHQQYKNSFSANDLNMAVQTIKLAIELSEKIRDYYQDDLSKLVLIDRIKKIFSNSLLILNNTENNNKYYEMFDFAERGKSFVLYSSLLGLKATENAGLSKELIEKEKKIKNERLQCYLKIEKIKEKDPQNNSLALKEYENNYFSFSQQHDSLINYFEKNYPRYYELKYQTSTFSVKDVQRHLDSASALLEYFIGDSALFVFSITNNSYNVHKLSIDSTFEKQVKEYIKSIKFSDINQFTTLSSSLYKLLIAPIYNDIKNKQHLVIIPDDYLFYLPFETLADCKTLDLNNTNYSQLPYLIKDFEVSYHYSATLWLSKTNYQSNFSQLVDGFVGFAPVFNDKNNILVDTSTIALRSMAVDGKRYKELPYTKDEITSIAKIFKQNGQPSAVFLYDKANKGAFLSHISKYKYVHIATHGFVNDENPSLSGLAFYPNKNDSTVGNILYSEEMYNLNLNADLVVLSACETGLGKLYKGEGLISMTRGFIYSGTPNIIYSLWKVNDKHTKELMEEFYKAVLNKNSYSHALRIAKLKMLQKSETAIPNFWGGLELIQMCSSK